MRKITSIAWMLVLGGGLGISTSWSEEQLPTPEQAAEKIEVAIEEKAQEAEAEAKKELAEESAAEAVSEEAAVPIPFQMPEWKMVTDEELVEALKLPEKATAEELLQFIRETDSLRPADLEEKDPAKQEAQVKAFLAKVFEARIVAVDKMLEDKELSSELKRTALSIKIMSLLTLSQIDSAYEEKLHALAAELRQGEDKELSWSVDAMLIQFEWSRAKEEAEMPTAEDYQHTVKALLDHMKKGIEWKCLDQAFVGIVAQFVMISEQMLPSQDAIALFNQFFAVLRSSEEKTLQQLADSLESVKKRLEMTGQVLDYTFQGMDGKAISVKDFAGKNLLIVFWAISDQNSLEEIPLLMQLFDFYHEKGLEVIAVTVDEDNEELRQMFEKVGFQWITVVNQPQNGSEKDENVISPAEYFGVTTLPLKIFVGTDSKVVSANMPLMELLETLEKAYGPLPKENVAEATDEGIEEAIYEAVEEAVEEIGLEAQADEEAVAKP